MTPQQRHRCMQSIRSKDTKPELIVRRFLHAHGFRYRLHLKNLPGHPDIVLRRWHTVVFVHGCFWHGHDDCKTFRMPKTNKEFWKSKIERNRLRDMRDRLQLRELGWHVITIWECQLKPKVRNDYLHALIHTLHQVVLEDMTTTDPHHSPRPYVLPDEEETMRAAEEDYQYYV